MAVLSIFELCDRATANAMPMIVIVCSCESQAFPERADWTPGHDQTQVGDGVQGLPGLSGLVHECSGMRAVHSLGLVKQKGLTKCHYRNSWPIRKSSLMERQPVSLGRF